MRVPKRLTGDGDAHWLHGRPGRRLTPTATREDTRLDRHDCLLTFTPVPQLEIVYALPERQTLLTLNVADGTTVANAIAASELAMHHPDLDWRTYAVGIFGKVVALDRVVRDGDRIEIYRPLIADPKDSRQARVEKQRAERGDGRKMRA